METLKKVALRKGLVCLLHEKPFAGVNGSGKHNNWSLNLDGHKSLLDQGKTPEQNARFLLFLAAVVWAVDEYAPLLRASISGAGNDCRLGGNEAPPAIISIFLGDFLTDVLNEIASGGESVIRQGGNLRIGVTTIPNLPKDISDRNRTSPFAFTGKKFEFRQLGSSMSIADCNTVINTIVAETLSRIADRLEAAADINEECRAILRDVMIAPTVPYGAADSLAGFPGTVSLGVDGLFRLLSGITDSLYAHGFRRFVLLNGHGGNAKSIEMLGQRLYARGAYVACLNWWLMAGELRPEWAGGHGGAEETAGVMAVDPALVDYDEIHDPLVLTDDIGADMVYACIFAHKWECLFYLIVFAVFMLAGGLFKNSRKSAAKATQK